MKSNIILKKGRYWNQRKQRIFWKKAINNWAKALEDYAENIFSTRDKSQGYYFDERANLGFLFLALHKAKAKALLQEFETIRIKKGKRKKSWGRCDLYAKIGSHDYYFEAKQIWPYTANSLETEYNASIKEAKTQLKSIAEARGTKTKKIIAVFIVLDLSQKEYDSKKKEGFKSFLTEIEKIYDKNENVLIAKFFPDKAAEWDHRFYPGIFLVLNKI